MDDIIKNFAKYIPADFREMCNNYASADTSTRIAESIKVKEKLDKEGEQI